jgi:hypothetical protein
VEAAAKRVSGNDQTHRHLHSARPFLVWLTFVMLHVPVLIQRPDRGVVGFFFMVLFFAVILGFVPALALAFADEFVARRGLPRVPRAAVSAVLAYPLATLAWWLAIRNAGMRSLADNLTLAGLFAMIPAAVCSWLAGRVGGKAGLQVDYALPALYAVIPGCLPRYPRRICLSRHQNKILIPALESDLIFPAPCSSRASSIAAFEDGAGCGARQCRRDGARPISGLPEIGLCMRASRVNPTCDEAQGSHAEGPRAPGPPPPLALGSRKLGA